MNDEYLWNKTGEDEEIRELESLLSVFRQPETELPPRIAAVQEPARSGWFLSLKMRLAAGFAVIVIVAAAAFSVMRSSPPATIARSNEHVIPKIVSELPAADPKRAADLTKAADKVERSAEKEEAKPRVTLATFRPARREQRRLKTVAVRGARQVELTPEEKFAYGQLKLALAISGSKLKIARDAINGGDMQESSETNTKR